VSSKRQKAAITLLLVFSTALVIVLARQYIMPPGKPNPPETPGGTINESSTRAEIEIDWPIPPVYSADLRDPMILGEPTTPPPPPPRRGVVVRGIVVSEDRKYAVIETKDLQGGSIVNYLQEGGIVPGTNKKVKTINPNNVEFEEDGKTWTQKVEGER
jgi:type II secretory pathway component PulC